jgi:hypothetical protein
MINQYFKVPPSNNILLEISVISRPAERSICNSIKSIHTPIHGGIEDHSGAQLPRQKPMTFEVTCKKYRSGSINQRVGIGWKPSCSWLERRRYRFKTSRHWQILLIFRCESGLGPRLVHSKLRSLMFCETNFKVRE